MLRDFGCFIILEISSIVVQELYVYYITFIDSKDNYQFTISRFLITPVIVRINIRKKKVGLSQR